MADNEQARHPQMPEYNVSNPHPMFGKDPNIVNEFGHTKYPRYVDHPTDKRVDHTTTNINNTQSVQNEHKTDFPVRVVVNNAKEEAELLGKSWDKKKDKKDEDEEPWSKGGK